MYFNSFHIEIVTISSRFSSNSETNVSEIQENLQEVFIYDYMHIVMCVTATATTWYYTTWYYTTWWLSANEFNCLFLTPTLCNNTLLVHTYTI